MHIYINTYPPFELRPSFLLRSEYTEISINNIEQNKLHAYIYSHRHVDTRLYITAHITPYRFHLSCVSQSVYNEVHYAFSPTH
jgi:hypothetical protein